MDKKILTTVSSYADKIKAKRVSVSSKGDTVTKPPLSSSSRQPSASSSHHPKTIGQSPCDQSQHETSNSSLTKVTLATSNEALKSTETTRMPFQPTRMHIVQNFLLIWLDSSIDKSNEDCQNSLTELRRIVNTVKTYTDADECVEFITETKDENIFVILSEALGFQHVHRIHDMPQIDSIYILCGNKSKNEQWTKEWMKVKGVFTDVRPLCEVLKQDTRLCDRDSTSITITNAKNSDELEPTFMYTTLFKEIILEIGYDKDEIHKLADECRKLYPDEDNELRTIQEFEREYYTHTPIWWYTRECFTYHILNRALRTFDTTTIVTMGFFIQGLHNRIKQLHSEQKHLFPETFTVYRGQGLRLIHLLHD